MSGNILSLSRLLDEAFELPTGKHYFDDFPVWSPELAVPGRVLALREDSQAIVACAMGRMAQYRTPLGELPVGIIGAVATAKTHRGQGLASAVVDEVARQLADKGAALLLLWGSEHTLYRRLGFELAGFQLRMSSKVILSWKHPIAQQVQSGWNDALLKLMQSRAGGLRLDSSDLLWLREQRNVFWVWTGDRDHPTSYAALGRGIDLSGMIHEYGGERVALCGLLTRLANEFPESQLIGNSWLWREMGWRSILGNTEYLAMMKVVDPDKVSKAWGKQTNPDAAQMGSGELAKYFFGPESLSGEGYLPFWLWGLDAA
jgi:GNAT superfamily N-acetyltransferase